ncbi:Uncharacterized protein Adt_28238 [Abeliophyllum distichum]|uniref:Uncharacterized protein n=1 Tax=Abeliophyllum distichum TaxID=126358 RepID=A0ABD1RVY7_9LAMI
MRVIQGIVLRLNHVKMSQVVRQESSILQNNGFTISLNVANFVTLKLIPENYPLWREQLRALAESQDMVGLLTGEKEKPTMYSNTTTPQQLKLQSMKQKRSQKNTSNGEKKIVSYVGGLLEHSSKKL